MEDIPCDVEGLFDGTVLVESLANDPVLEDVCEVEEFLVLCGQGLLTDDCDKSTKILTLCICCIELMTIVSN